MIVNNESYCIGIMTYSKRKEYVKLLIEDIRKQSDITIYLAINCDYKQEFDNNYRKDMLNLCMQYDNLYPCFYLKFRGCARVWNDIIVNANYDNCLILNDDCRVVNNFIRDIIEYKVSNNIDSIVKTNKCWSSFLVNKKFIQQAGFFNEHYLGVGFEDTEFVHRVGEFPSFDTENWISLTDESKQTFPGNEESNLSDSKNYSSFNAQLFANGVIGRGQNFRPYEIFYDTNYNNIF